MRVAFRTILKYIWSQARPHKWFFFLTFFGYGVAIIMSDVINPLLYRRLVDTITLTTDRTSVAHDLVTLLIYVAISMTAYNVLFRIGDYAIARFQARTIKDLNDFAFAQLSKHSYAFFTNTFAGSLVAKVRRFSRAYETMHDQVAFAFWMTAVQLISILTALTITEPKLAAFFAGWILLYVPMTLYLTNKNIPLDIIEAEKDSKLTGQLADAITNILNLKIFSSRRREIATYDKVTSEERDARIATWKFRNLTFFFQSVALSLFELLGISLAVYLWLQGSISTGTVVLMQLYMGVMWYNLWNIGRAMNRFSQGLADASEMIEIFETPIDIKDPAQPEKLATKNGTIELHDLSFRYGEDKNDVFTNFSLTIPAGQRLGLVGHSGAGKSTITKLLLRFADIQKGAIAIDGQDITKITQDDLRSVIAYVPQEPILFHRSLRENIAYGKPNATDEEIIEAAKKAHAHEFITSLPQGYETLVGERGVKLSGGERQRVAIARAMLKDAPILILDEATSSLDAVSEKYIQEAFKELMEGRTTIVIAHRLSTIQKLDRIVVLENGAIVEEGTHDELLAKEGIYQNFWKHQTDGFIE